MVGMDVGYGEEVLAECSNAHWTAKLNNVDLNIDTLVLTNKRIYGLYRKSNGVFKKPSEEIIEIQLADIVISGGRPRVSRKWDANTFHWCLEVQCSNGLNIFNFAESSKKITALWENEINNVFGVSESAKTKNNFASEGMSEIATGLKEVAETVFGKEKERPERKLNIKAGQAHRNDSQNNYRTQEQKTSDASFSQKAKNSLFCSHCGTELNKGSQFCHVCGTPVNVNSEKAQETPTANKRTARGTYDERVQEYAGTVLKCPNCGNVLSALDAVCDVCGMRISNKTASSAVQKLSDSLMTIEREKIVENNGRIFQQFKYEERVENANKIALSRKLTLIRTFPIPNSVDEIYEFMILAATNIDVKLSRNTRLNKISNTGDPEKEVSNAWVEKMKQAYKKAEISFPNDSIFPHIKKIYYEKMDELKMTP